MTSKITSLIKDDVTVQKILTSICKYIFDLYTYNNISSRKALSSFPILIHIVNTKYAVTVT